LENKSHLLSSRKLHTNLRTFLLTGALLVFALVVMGGVLRVTQSGGTCPDWPTCFGAWTPFPGADPAVFQDYLHRALTIAAGLPLVTAAWLAWRRARSERAVLLALFTAVTLLLLQVGIGALVTLVGLPKDQQWLSSLHLVLSLAILSTLVRALVPLFYPDAGARRLSFRSPFGRQSWFSVLSLLAVLLGGLVVARSGAGLACDGWPLCRPQSLLGWLSLGHRLLVGAAVLAMVAWLVNAWRTQRSQVPVLVATTITVMLFFAQALLGAQLVQDFPIDLLVLHQVTAVAVWVAASIQLVTLGLADRSAQQEASEADEIRGRAFAPLLKDLLMLTKPIVVALLLVTTYAGMVIGAQAWPSASLVFWTLLGGFMAAGGSGAINQYIDRDDDQKMQRTQKRPIPSGRLTAAEGLAFGAALLVASFYLLTAFVNLLAALLSLAGMIYYVLIYSIFLKKTTVQNIVIGGGAGAIPPLVGWAAATGSLNIPALFLFAVIFMWTPPHFWALALVRRQDYARAGVPMLPVVRGEEETRRQILIYTLELVALTLVLPLFGLGGAVYLVGAALLGLWLLHAAWKVFREGGNKLAWKMYRYSSMYLAFIFFVLMADRLL
jgi:protoheme IX farnesyltransferase